MSSLQNQTIVLDSRPMGIPLASHFRISSQTIPELKPGEVLLKNRFLSVEPAMRGWLSDAGNYSTPVGIGSIIPALALAEVQASKAEHLAAGDTVVGMFGWQEYCVCNADIIERRVVDQGQGLSVHLGVLGINGIAAYFGLMEIGQPKQGETVVISSAAGALGSCVGQIAKLHGCRTIGITSSDDKIRQCLDDYRFDAALNYNDPSFSQLLAETVATGVDLYFDNTSGAISDTVAPHMNNFSRIVVCGTAAISQWQPKPLGPRIERDILIKRIRMQGFVVFDYQARYNEAIQALSNWLAEGNINYREHITDGLPSALDAIASLYRSENTGKRLIRL